MALEDKIYTRLTSSTTITDYAGTRIYPVIAPEHVTNPYIVYERISGGQINTLSGYATHEKPDIAIDVFSTSYTQAKSLSESVHTLMNGSTTFSAILNDDFDDYDLETKLYNVRQVYSCLNRE